MSKVRFLLENIGFSALLTLLAFFPSYFSAQQLPVEDINPDLLSKFWSADWITHPTASTQDWGIFHFRRDIQLDEVPERLVVHLSGDNRYRFYINGREIVHGPARHDLDHWHYESINIAPFLREGDNVLAAVVWNFGEHRPVFQQSHATAFLLQADDPKYSSFNTGEEGWKVYGNEAYSPEVEAIYALRTFHVTGPGERVDGKEYPWGWEQVDYDNSDWPAARNLARAHPAVAGTGHNWGLTPRPLPLMEERVVRLARVRRSEGGTAPDAFLEGIAPMVIPDDSRVILLFDQDHLTNAYPVLSTSGGAGSSITLTYAEALYLPEGNNRKGNRDVVEGKEMRGQQDVFLPDGGEQRIYTPLWFRTYRYLQLEIETGEEPLTLNDLYGRFTGYPFEEQASFSSDDDALADIWEVGWRTARLCAGETYYDCPYYEQLQYVGDTRIQALISLYVSGDDRLVRQAIDHYDHSRESMGLTHSRYPEGRPVQFIPTYSLFWISMVHDYWMHREDPDYVQSKLMGIQTVLHWFSQQIDAETGLVGRAPYWNFVDWSWSWDPGEGMGGVPRLEGGSSILSLQLAYTLDQAADLMSAFGEEQLEQRYRKEALALKEAVLEQCWNADRGLLADTPAKEDFSQHANIFGLLTQAIPEVERAEVLERVLEDASLTQATFYFQFYLFEILHRFGAGDRYIERLQPWRDMLGRGLTTFAENPDPTRSDCHAWSASPNYHLLSLVCGIRPADPGFRTVEIRPSLGPLQRVSAEMPHPAGAIEMNLQRRGTDGIQGTVTLPEGLSGYFHWNGQDVRLEGGEQPIRF